MSELVFERCQDVVLVGQGGVDACLDRQFFLELIGLKGTYRSRFAEPSGHLKSVRHGNRRLAKHCEHDHWVFLNVSKRQVLNSCFALSFKLSHFQEYADCFLFGLNLSFGHPVNDDSSNNRLL